MKLNAFCQSCGDWSCPDCSPGHELYRANDRLAGLLRGMALRVAYWRAEAKDARRKQQLTRTLNSFLYHRATSAEEKVSALQAELDWTQTALAESHAAINTLTRGIARRGCTNYIGTANCRQEGLGRTRGGTSEYDSWCDACVAIDALGYDPSGRS